MDIFNIFKEITFLRFCVVSATVLQEDLGLPTEKLICLYKECIEMAKHCNDIYIMVGSCMKFVSHSNSIGRHADSLRCLKEILPSAEVDPEYELIIHEYLSLTYEELREFDNVVLHAKKWTEIARKIGHKEKEMLGYHSMGKTFLCLDRYDDAIDCCKKCLKITHEVDSTYVEMLAYECIMLAYKCMQKYNDTIVYAHEFLDCAKKTNDQKAMMTAYLALGRAHLHMNNYQVATDCGKKCIEIAREIEDRRSEVQAYLLMGQVYKALSDYDNAIIYCNKCIELAITIGDKHAEAHAYILLGSMYCSLGKYDDSISNCNKCLHIDKKDDIAYMTLGIVNQSLKKYDEAIQYFMKCIDLAQETGQKTDEAQACLNLSSSYKSLNEKDTAIQYGKKCIDLAQETGEKTIEAKACLDLSSLYQTLDEKDTAIQYGKKCIDLAQETGQKTIEALACLPLSSLYQTLDEKDNAIQYVKKCIDLAQETGEKTIEAHACLGLLSLYETLDDKDTAIQYGKKCIDLAQETGEKTIEAQACLGLLSLYLLSTLDDKDTAIQYGKKCIDLAKETGEKKIEMQGHHDLALAYQLSTQLNDAKLSIDAGMAIATELGDKEREEKFKVILLIFHLTVGLYDKDCDVPSVREVLMGPNATCSEEDLLEDLEHTVKPNKEPDKQLAISILYLLKHDYKKSLSRIEQLKEMNVAPFLNLSFFTTLGHLYQKMGQTDMALRCYKEGLPTAESCTDNGQRSKFYFDFGELLFSLNRELNLAERYLREAVRCFEAIFTTLGSRDEFKISIFDQYINSYKLLATVLIIGEQAWEALLVLDRCRARALKDLMISNYKMEQEGSNDEHIEFIDALLAALKNDFSISYYAVCSGIFLTFFFGGDGLNLHVSTLPNVINLQKLQLYVDTLFDEMGVREVVNCEDRSLDKEQDIQKEQTRCIEDHEELHQAAASLLNLDSKGGESNEHDSTETNGSSLGVLFAILKCDKILSSEKDEVVIIPEGPSYQVPFPALRDPRTGKYLSETKRIRLAPSLATLKHFEDFPADQSSNAPPLIIGDPLVGRVMMDGEERADIKPLTGARKEAAEISLLLNTPALLGEHATKPAVIKRLQEGVSVVHIAAHGILSKATIVLAPSPEIRATKIPDEEDYMLTMADVQQAKVSAQLVVLSCCHSGRGEIRAEGVVGMCRAFLASGCRAVVASLWAIDDDATFAFMQKFYHSLKDGKSASASLQQAMKEMRNTTNYSEPKYWAPFFLMGDDVTLKL